MNLSRDDILAVNDVKIKEVAVPEWGKKASVFVRGMTGEERDEFEESMFSLRSGKRTANLKNLRARLAALTICNEAGEALFTPEDAAALGKKSAAALQRVFMVAQDLSGISAQAVEDLTKEVEDNPL